MPNPPPKKESWGDWATRHFYHDIVPQLPTQVQVALALRNSNNPTAKKVRQYVGQVPAGLAEQTIANSARKNETGYNIAGYRPAIMDTPGALIAAVGAITHAVQGKKPNANGKVFSGDTAIERYANDALDRSKLASDRTNETLRIDNPQNTGQLAARILPSLLVGPNKGSGVAKALSETALATRATEALARAPAIVRSAAKVAGKVGATAAEMALPMRQTGLKSAAVLGAGMTGVADALNDAGNPDYNGTVLPLVHGGTDYHAADEFDDAVAPTPAPTDPTTITATSPADPNAPPPDEFDTTLSVPPPQTQDHQDYVEAEQKGFDWQTAGEALAVLGIGAAALKYVPKLIPTRVEQAVEQMPTFVGKKFRPSRATAAERVKTSFIDQATPARSAADEFMSPQSAATFNNNADLISNVAIGAKARSTFVKGKLPGVTGWRTQPLQPLHEAFATELHPEEQRTVADALLAQSALDDYNRTGTLSALNLDRDGNAVTPATLQAQVLAARSNPTYVKYMDAVTSSYQDLLKFRVARGTISPEMAAELGDMRPNYVRFQRNLKTDAPVGDAAPFNANENRMAGAFERATDENQGVQGVTGVGNPFNMVMDDWANEIRRAEVNDLRAHFLTNMDATGATVPVGGRMRQLVERIPNGVAPATDEGIHTVRIQGKDVSFRVRDPLISKSLEFAPRATISQLEAYRQVSQNLITGPLGTLTNLFGFFKSPFYDTTMGMLLKPDNVHLGLINEALSKYDKSIGRLDPTAPFTAFTGAIRHMGDSLVEHMADSLSQQLIKDHSMLRNVIGDANVGALRDVFAQAYDGSIKSMMDDLGIESHTMHGTPDPSQVMSGLSAITPKFSSQMAHQLAADTWDAMKAGQVSPFKAMLQNLKAGYAYDRAGMLARAYSGLLEASHNGFRYSMVAANKDRNPNLTQLASQARKISVDSTRHGSSDGFNKIVGSLNYANLTIQSLHAVGEKLIKNPTGFLGNFMSFALPLMAMHYTAMATDKDAAEFHKNKTAAQKARAVTTFGGAEIPIDPIMRMALSPLMAIMDHVTGAHDGKWNGNILQAFSNYLDNDHHDREGLAQDQSDMFWDNMLSNSPVTTDAIPGGSFALASAGIDPGMTRGTGTAVPVRTQRETGFDANEAMPHSLLSAQGEALITAITGSVGQNMMAVANDTYRGLYGSNDVGTALHMGASRYVSGLQRGAAVAKPLLFGNRTELQSVADTNWQLVTAKDKGIKTAQAILDRDINREASIKPSGGKFHHPGETDEPQLREQVRGTENEYIASTVNLMRQSPTLHAVDQRLKDLSAAVEGARNGYVTPADKKAGKINEINEQRKYFNLLKLQIIQTNEHQIRQRLGDPYFTFDTYNPNDHKKPLKPQAVPTPPAQ